MAEKEIWAARTENKLHPKMDQRKRLQHIHNISHSILQLSIRYVIEGRGAPGARTHDLEASWSLIKKGPSPLFGSGGPKEKGCPKRNGREVKRRKEGWRHEETAAQQWWDAFGRNAYYHRLSASLWGNAGKGGRQTGWKKTPPRRKERAARVSAGRHKGAGAIQ